MNNYTEEWCKQMVSDHPQFDYWYRVYKLELLFLQFLRSQRKPEFVPYVESLGKIIPWMFALDHYHYARWMTVHVRDLLALENNCPEIHAQFIIGNFVTQKTTHKFSAIPHDQVHEQLNAMVKGDGGAIGVTENEAALTRWMVAGPETARLLNEYDDKQSVNKKHTERHHEQIPSVQKTFLSQVKSVTDVMEELGNPFADTSTDLYTLHTKLIMPDSVVHTVRTAEELGKTQYQRFVEERVNDNITAFNDTIHKNNLPLLTLVQERHLRSPLPRYPACRLMFNYFHGCTYHVKPETVIWMHFSHMRITLGLHHRRQIASCTKQPSLT